LIDLLIYLFIYKYFVAIPTVYAVLLESKCCQAVVAPTQWRRRHYDNRPAWRHHWPMTSLCRQSRTSPPVWNS